MFKRRILPLLTIVSLTISMFVGLVPQKAAALSGSDFRAGRIIDDVKFFNAGTMSADDIHRFLAAKVPTCDIWGQQMYSGSQTRAQYSASRGYSTPFICLKDFRSATPARAAETGLCNGLFASGDDGAAGIIYRVAQSCGINPQVLLVLLQKEQSLVTDDWPWPTQYRSATGYGCPDTAPCDSEYYGFFNQVYMAARQFKKYARDPNNYNYRTNANNFILYNPNSSCGGSTVFIENQATAGLYNYTPYQPNASALNNLYGNGDSCGAYGNRNFWRMFNDWFGPPIVTCDYPAGWGPAPENIYSNFGTATIPGKWTSATGQGFAYVRPTSKGFDVSIMDSSPSGLVDRGVWWSNTNGGINVSNTVLIPARNGQGLTDLYYATAADWSKNGFTVGVMRNTGTGFVYGGNQWTPSFLSMSKTAFIPGNWTGGQTAQGFGYATPNSSGGFDFGVMAPAPSTGNLAWQGTKWNQTNGAIGTGNTKFIPADVDVDGVSDLYYATSTNWSVPGFNVGLMHNDGPSFSWRGTQWTNTSLNLGKTFFVPGAWTGPGTPEGIAYSTSCGSRGFEAGVMIPGTGQLNSLGTWWQASTVQQTTTALIPADQDGDGFTDLYYTSPIGNNGFDVSLQRNINGASFNWSGIHWSPRSIPLRTTLFLPSR